jgi:hypothetical protein
VILTGSVSRASEAAAELCDAGPIPKPYEPKLAADRIKQLMALRARKNEERGKGRTPILHHPR